MQQTIIEKDALMKKISAEIAEKDALMKRISVERNNFSQMVNQLKKINSTLKAQSNEKIVENKSQLEAYSGEQAKFEQEIFEVKQQLEQERKRRKEFEELLNMMNLEKKSLESKFSVLDVTQNSEI